MRMGQNLRHNFENLRQNFTNSTNAKAGTFEPQTLRKKKRPV